MGPTAFAVRAECHARAASGGEIIIADVSMSLDNVLAAGDAARASLGLFFVLVFSTALPATCRPFVDLGHNQSVQGYRNILGYHLRATGRLHKSCISALGCRLSVVLL